MTITLTAPEGRVFAGVELREVESTASYSMLRGIAVPYDELASIGWFLEEFAPGSLAKSIKEAARALPLNLFHENRTFPIGAADEWTEAERGLIGTWRLDGSELAQEAARLAEAGMLTGLSIEFAPIRSEWTEAREWDPSRGPDYMDRVRRVEARLGAVGLVQTPAYVSAGVELVRSVDARQRAAQTTGTPVLDAMRAQTEALRRG
ncbi:MAG: hypothetical protein CMF72_24760 [Mameliella sp.]|nr:hypothetical protein [Mameliella sp.]